MQQETNDYSEKGTSNAHPSFLSVVAPAYNEEAVLPAFHARLIKVLNELGVQYEILYVNDGSKDQTINILNDLRNGNEHVSVIDLSRNFGKELALTAGLDHAVGDAIVVIDTDLQDPPEVIPDLLSKMHEGYDIVYAKRSQREGETLFKKLSANLFYRFIQILSYINIPEDTGDFRVISRRALDELKRLREQHRFMKGLFSWVGFPQTAVRYRRDPRYAGHTKWSYWKLWNFALEGITSFSTKPLKIASYIGVITALAAFLYAIVVVLKKFLYGDPVAGYPSLMAVILFLGGVQLITIGIIGEYLARTFNETKNRPLYIVKQYSPAGSTKQKSERGQVD
ncbi:MAG: glycosyltransferase family 2 protein [Methylococcales bacterium]